MSELFRELRTGGVGDALSTAMRVYQRDFARYVLIVSPYALPVFAFFLVLCRRTFMPHAGPDEAGTFAVVLVFLLFLLFTYMLPRAAFVAVFAGRLRGRAVSPWRAWQEALRRWPSLLRATLPGGSKDLSDVAMIWEGLGASDAGRRSRTILESKAFRRVSSSRRALLVARVGSGTVVVLPALAVLMLAQSGTFGERPGWTVSVMMAGYVAASYTLALPFIEIMRILCYYDYRVRVEGYDLEVAAEAMERGGSAAAAEGEKA